ncbi:hypothetical protein LCGC14_1215300 [marine sediment metagenome]|uniref:Uncharacterized protein n=1 Tax=marine sediment metagenome TaxID=412755 RepID=A0A0F9LH37_9ZZZZ
MKLAFELRTELLAIRDGAANSLSNKEIVVALDQLLYQIDMDEMNDLENFLIEQEFNATFGNGNNPYQEIAFQEVPFYELSSE